MLYGQSSLDVGVRSRMLAKVNGLNMHILEAGYEAAQAKPCVLLLHGFPELAFSWRKQLLPLAEAGFHVVAPDLRGYGLTTGWDGDYDGDVASYRTLNLVADVVALVHALGYKSVTAVVGHDFGSPIAAWCALIRPDLFRSVVLMSSPFGGALRPKSRQGKSIAKDESTRVQPNVHADLAQLPVPRIHYQRYYSGRDANDNLQHCTQGVARFLRAYYHMKSAAWKNNKPAPLGSWSASELAKMPQYYIMYLDKGMAQTVAEEYPTHGEIAQCHWLTQEELSVYAQTYERTGFQGGLQWYRCASDSLINTDLKVFAGRKIDVPCYFIAGASDWGVYQAPGNLERMQTSACSQFVSMHILEGAGHWVQQEQSQQVNALLVGIFLGGE